MSTKKGWKEYLHSLLAVLEPVKRQRLQIRHINNPIAGNVTIKIRPLLFLSYPLYAVR
jgi:hypothetical protein